MQVKTRDEIEEKYTWKTEDMIASKEEWDRLYSAVENGIAEITAYSGKLNDKKNILDCLKTSTKYEDILSRMFCYSHMKRDQDVGNGENKALYDSVYNLYIRYSGETSFVMPQLSALDESYLKELASDKDFADYSYLIEGIIKDKKHTLGEKEEKILAMTHMFSSVPQEAFSMLNNADIRFEPFKDSKGEEIKLSHGVYSLMMQSPVREDREKAFNSMYHAFESNINTLASLYNGNVQKNVFYARVRGFDSCLAAAAHGEDVPTAVYERLSACIDANVGKLHDYLEFRRKKMGLDKLHMYDLHVPVVEGYEMGMDYEDACKLVVKALAPMGERYCKLLEKAFAERWVDVYENKGKRSGAYSTGCYGCHPYVLLNYQRTTHDVFTIAHEMGHSLHTYFSNETQPMSKADYKIFVAEVASTINETLLLNYLLKNCKDKKEKEFLLAYMLDMFRTTVFRQTQFAQFEYAAHTAAENGTALTPDFLNDLYYKLNCKYYGGESVVNDDLIKYEWSRIPHFYTAFYVYKYATGLISAVCIAADILEKGESALNNYMKFLSAGGSMPPVEILKLAGVDLTTDEPFEKAMKVMDNYLKELRSL